MFVSKSCDSDEVLECNMKAGAGRLGMAAHARRPEEMRGSARSGRRVALFGECATFKEGLAHHKLSTEGQKLLPQLRETRNARHSQNAQPVGSIGLQGTQLKFRITKCASNVSMVEIR